MLGHSNPTIPAKAYLPWVKELEQSTIAEARKALAKATPTASKVQKVVRISRR